MIKIQEAVIVEGKYDKIKLSNLLDALIIETNGFAIYKDKARMQFIRRLAQERGIILLTDSDHSGFQIRNYIAGGIPADRIKHIYIPDIYGKEKRKSAPSKEGKLGVEGVSDALLLDLFSKCNVACTQVPERERITAFDLYEAGLSGQPGSRQKKKKFLKMLDLPEFLSTNSLLSYLNTSMTKTDFLDYMTAI